MIKRFSNEELKELKHPKENSRFTLAVVVCVPIALALFFLAFISLGFVMISFLSIIVTLWFAQAMTKAHLTGNAMRVSAKNFPEIYHMVEEVKYTLRYDKEVPVFIIEGNSINALLSKFFQLNYIILHAELVKDMLDGKNILQLKWFIARFIGALKTKEIRLDIFKIILESIESLKILNLLILPYTRAVQLTGDNIGLAVCGDLLETMRAFDKLLVGNSLAKRVHLSGILEQSQETKSSFPAKLVRLFSAYPYNVERYCNLLALGKRYFPAQYDTYVAQLGLGAYYEMKQVLPNHYAGLSVSRPNKQWLERDVIVVKKKSSPKRVPIKIQKHQ